MKSTRSFVGRFLAVAMIGVFSTPLMAQEFSLTTLFGPNNNNRSGGAVFFDLENTGSDTVTVLSWDANIGGVVDFATDATEVPEGGPEGLPYVEIYYRSGTHVGAETSFTGWTLLGGLEVDFQGKDTGTPVPIGGLIIGPGEVAGIAFVVYELNSRYTDGDGGNQVYSGDGLTLTAGSATNELFVPGTVFAPRVWNGTVYFDRGDPPAEARFEVSKNFGDNNTASVDVTLSCNTGLPLTQTTSITQGDPVNFVVGDFEQGTLDCTVTEDVPAGYTPGYQIDPLGQSNPDNCSWTELTGGQYECLITNLLDPVVVAVTKNWIDEGPGHFAENYAEAIALCSNTAGPFPPETLEFYGETSTRTFNVLPRWDGTTRCSIVEVDVMDGGVEIDDSACKGLVVTPGNGNACTITNTRLFEGIPTLSQYGLALMALLMLGVGFVTFRRFG